MDERTLLERYRPWLTARARVLLGTDQRWLDDCSQEGWIAIWREVRKTGRIDPPWLQAVAHNRMRNWIRDELTTVKRGSLVTYVEDLSQVWEGAYALAAVELAYHHGELFRALQALTPQQREYVVLRFWGGWEASELNRHFRTQNSGSIWTAARRKLTRELVALAVEVSPSPAPRQHGAARGRTS